MSNNGRLFGLSSSNNRLFTILIMLVLLLVACGGGDTAPASELAIEPNAVLEQEAADEDGDEGHPDETESGTEEEAHADDQDGDAGHSADSEMGDEEAETAQVEGMRTFVIAPSESQASYLVDEEFLENALSKLGIEAGEKDVVGTTAEVSGQLQLNMDDLSAVLGENTFAVDLSQLNSDQDRRDKWIQENGPTFGRFPMATFTATAVSGLPDSYAEGEEIQFQVSGDLTVHEVTVPVIFDATVSLQGDTLTGTLETRRLISEFGIDPPAFAGTLKVADEFGILVEFTAREE